MITVPVALIIERHQEQIRAFQALQDGLRVRVSRERFCQRRTQPIQNRGSQQKLLQLGGLLLQKLAYKIIDDVAICSAEGLQKSRAIWTSRYGQCGEQEASNPPLGSFVE